MVSLMWDQIQWCASVLGMLGAITNSVGGRLLRLTWPIWLMSNVLGIAALWHLHAHGFLAQQSFYLGTTLIGGFRQFLPKQWSWVEDHTIHACKRWRNDVFGQSDA
ncbi:hypothetical protein SAMN05192544_102591 [Paraburkholderia hospita]|nr:hypothetical protein SAMN05192544_102591 [Paraburkholderia hospita]